jgi:peptidoglycan/LPS O-acetylase OafA/YrhL
LSFRLGFRPELDGLRGVAILLVLMSHFSGFPRGGFLGVDLFFVLSGFLITSLLLEEAFERGDVRLLSFYARRALRLLPALLVFMIALLAVGGYGFNSLSLARHPSIPIPVRQRLRLGPELFYTLFYSFNLGVVWKSFGPYGPLGVTWSLAIEEQFYLIWPWVLRLCLRSGLRLQSIGSGLAGLLGLVVFWRAWLSLTGASWMRLYYGSDTRCDGLLIGCLLAVVLASGRLPAGYNPRGLGRVTFLLLASLLGVAVCCAGQTGLFVGLGTLIELGFAACVALVVVGPNLPGVGLLRLGWLRWLGKISYSLYLWHWAVKLAVQPLDMPGLFNAYVAKMIGLSLALACASHYLVELPFLRLKKRFSMVRQERPDGFTSSNGSGRRGSG